MKGSFMATDLGSSINMKFEINGYEVSIAADNSLDGRNHEMRRFSLCVFENDENITSQIFKKDEVFGCNEEDVLIAMNWCKNKSKII